MLTEEKRKARNVELYPRVAGGDAAAVKEMILNNVGRLRLRVNLFCKSNPKYKHLREDIQSVATLELAKAAHRLGRDDRADTNDINAFLTRVLTQAISDAADNLWGAVRVPGRTRKRLQARGAVAPISTAFSQTDLAPTDFIAPADNAGELLEEILAVCKTPEEKTVIELLAAGHALEEIPAHLPRVLRYPKDGRPPCASEIRRAAARGESLAEQVDPVPELVSVEYVHRVRERVRQRFATKGFQHA